MVHYVHVIGRQHGIISSKTDDQIRCLENTFKITLPEGSKWHGIYYKQARKGDPSWLRKELIFACMGHKGLKRLDEIWYHTWIFEVNLEIQGDYKECLIRQVLGLDMTVERMKDTEGRRLDAVKKCMLELRNKIHWLNIRSRQGDSEGCRSFGEYFGIGRDV